MDRPLDRHDILQRLTGHAPVRVILCGGGTGGHTYPAAATARALRALTAEAGTTIDLLWVGTPDSLEQRIAAENDVPFAAIRSGKLRRDRNPLKMLNIANAKDALRLPISVLTAHNLVRRCRPDAILCTGGYVSAPIGIASALNRRPLVIHEQTTGIGRANHLLARAATRIALSSTASLDLLPTKLRTRAVVTGNPIRATLTSGEPHEAIEALDWSGYNSALPTVYITGGAQGAVQINELISAVLPELLNEANVIHQCGRSSIDKARHQATELPNRLRPRYVPREFVGTELPHVLALADLIVSRSGAGTLAELTALGKPSILIPYPHSVDGEQIRGARHLADHGAARALINEEATHTKLQHALHTLLTEPGQRATMSQAARALGRPHAAEDLALHILDLAVDAPALVP
ncbi:UDP-N-acetylglucosamine--N-acetylmuramyl-(pentapeptide) pyrophosphoryl-undecaprenol N-acetylglucosamine transferase [Nocardia sp. NPDC046473]|uniref:UDP-N-acetylglucosamine--N-acetylmuramyl- (pentapeptide) pyrophosphoryl-undecaprenol N-acetylglucosamine transferase n=1 Tax=Nocardia sp. NPDC046473 TaxID=3155733 RepID=UPI0033CC1B09